MSKDTFYFSHDYNARSDPKIKRLISKHGMLGYGVYWGIIEDLYNNANALPTDYDCIAFDMRTDKNVTKSIINDFDLFVISGKEFGSLSVQRRLEERNEKSQKARESAFKRWEDKRTQSEGNANALQSQCEGNAIKESKGKKKRKSYDAKKFVPPTQEEVTEYFKANGYPESLAVKFFKGYDVAEWKDRSGNPVKSWKQKAVHVWFKDENKSPMDKKQAEEQRKQRAMAKLHQGRPESIPIGTMMDFVEGGQAWRMKHMKSGEVFINKLNV